MEGGLTTSELAALISENGPFAPGRSLRGEEIIESIGSLLHYNAHPEFVTLMVSEPATQDYAGVEGFKEAWTDWMYPYEGFRIEFDEAIRMDNQVVFLVRQIGTTRHNDVVVENPSAAIFRLEDGQIRQAAFYLDQRAGMKAAGIDPDRPRGD